MTTHLQEEIKKALEKTPLTNDLTNAQANELTNHFRIKFISSNLAFSNQISLSTEEIIRVVDSNLRINNKNLIIQQEAINLNNCYRLIQEWVKNDKKIERKNLIKLYSILDDGLSKAQNKDFRSSQATVPNSKKLFPAPDKINNLISGYLDWFNSLKLDQNKAIKQVINIHYGLSYIHPFEGKNDLIARILVSYRLMQTKLPPLVIKASEKDSYQQTIITAHKQANLKPLRTILEQSILTSLIERDQIINQVQQQKIYPLATKKKDLLKIGQLANKTAETVPTIRHWTQKELLRPVGETKGGFMLYDKESIEIAKKIRELQKQRLNLEEIKSILSENN